MSGRVDLGQGGGHLLFDGGFRNIPGVFCQAREHAQDISVHCGDRQSKGDGGNGARGVGADPGQRAELLIGAGKSPAGLFTDAARGLLQVAGAGIVAQPLPELQQLLLADLRQGLNAGEPGHEALIIGDDGIHPGLLKHDLRHPNTVGVGVLAPGQNAGALPVPGQQRRYNFLQAKAVCVVQDGGRLIFHSDPRFFFYFIRFRLLNQFFSEMSARGAGRPKTGR